MSHAFPKMASIPEDSVKAVRIKKSLELVDKRETSARAHTHTHVCRACLSEAS